MSVRELFMKSQLTKNRFDAMFGVKKESQDFGKVLSLYSIDERSLYDLLWQKFNIPGMEVRIANTAFDYLIDSCAVRKDFNKSIVREIHDDILASSVFYTNIAPNACCTSDFR